MEKNFDKAVLHVLYVEGGYSNHPDDKGGPTKYGITLAALSIYRSSAVTAEDILNLSQAEAIEIYRREFWLKGNFGLIEDPRLSLIVFDQAVNRGSRVAIRMLQEALNNLGQDIAVDGVLGGQTTGAIKAVDLNKLYATFILEAQKAYFDLVDKKASQRVFLRGWMARTWKLLAMV